MFILTVRHDRQNVWAQGRNLGSRFSPYSFKHMPHVIKKFDSNDSLMDDECDDIFSTCRCNDRKPLEVYSRRFPMGFHTHCNKIIIKLRIARLLI
jgi:hypothetical protein